MKRRTFLQALAAVPVAGVAVAKSPSVMPESPSVRRPGIYRALITANSGMEADDIWTAMGRPADIKIVAPGAMLCGMGTEMLMLAHNEEAKQWVNEVCRTRLLPHGEEVHVGWIEDEFDWGSKCGVAASFINFGNAQMRRQACRFHVPLSELTYSKRIEAKAQLLQWYIDNPPPEDRSYS